MKRTAIRVEPISNYLERRRRGSIYPVIVAGEDVHFIACGAHLAAICIARK